MGHGMNRHLFLKPHYRPFFVCGRLIGWRVYTRNAKGQLVFSGHLILDKFRG
jgi:hypothetical protein